MYTRNRFHFRSCRISNILRLNSEQHSKMLRHCCDIPVETVHRRTYPVWWRFRKYAWWRWTAKFWSCVRNRRVSSVLASSSTWNVDRSGKSWIESNRSRLLNRFYFNRTVIPESWTLLGLIFVMNTVLIRQNSMALCHWCSERHRHGFGSSPIVAKWSIFLSSSDFPFISSPPSNLRSPNSSFSRSKQQKARIKTLVLLKLSSPLWQSQITQLKWCWINFALPIMIASQTNQRSPLRKWYHSNSQSQPISSPHPYHVIKNDVCWWKWNMF